MIFAGPDRPLNAHTLHGRPAFCVVMRREMPRDPQFCRMTALLLLTPTATTSPLLSAVTPLKLTPLGMLTRLQLEPFHCSAKPPPTAQMLLAETAAIPVNRLLR